MQFFYDLSSLGNFYSFSVDVIVWLVQALFACILYALIIFLFYFYFYFKYFYF